MPGLLQAGMDQQQQPQPQPQPMPPQGAPQGGPPPQQPMLPPQGQPPQGQPPQGPPGPPQEEGGDKQAMVTTLVEGMLNTLYEEGVTRGVEEILQQWDNPVEAMGRAVHDVMMVTNGLIEQEGRQVPPEVMLKAGIELSRGVGELAIEMGEVEEDDELAIEMGLFIALAMMGEDMQSEQGEQYKQMAQQLAEQRMGMIDPRSLDQETLALLQEGGA